MAIEFACVVASRWFRFRWRRRDLLLLELLLDCLEGLPLFCFCRRLLCLEVMLVFWVLLAVLLLEEAEIGVRLGMLFLMSCDIRCYRR